VLVHGLDEPGDIWTDVIQVLQEHPVEVMEFRYPNDQAIESSADFLAAEWADLPQGRPVVFIAHSMGGLVVRDFVLRHYAREEQGSSLPGPSVQAAWLVATPNHGSNWARLRIWLEWREHFLSAADGDYALLSGIQDGTGAAKVDLRPVSRFLKELNARSWPTAVNLRLIAGVYLESEDVHGRLRDLLEQAPNESMAEALSSLASELKAGIGDGAVTLESVRLDGFPPPLVLPASHRGLIRTSPIDADPPPASPYLLKWLQAELSQ
jgi:pimeloyl-ACP methyl ester carboxylesterase